MAASQTEMFPERKSLAHRLLVTWEGELRLFWALRATDQAEAMNARFLRRSPSKDIMAQQVPGDTAGSAAVSASPADRACCCPAKAVVRIVMPPSPTRPRAVAAVRSPLPHLPSRPDGRAGCHLRATRNLPRRSGVDRLRPGQLSHSGQLTSGPSSVYRWPSVG